MLLALATGALLLLLNRGNTLGWASPLVLGLAAAAALLVPALAVVERRAPRGARSRRRALASGSVAPSIFVLENG